MHLSRLSVCSGLILVLAGCDFTGCDKNPGSSSTTAASASAAARPASSAAASGAAAASSAQDPNAEAPVFLAYQGKIGGQGDFRIVLQRMGDKLEGLYTRGSGEDVVVRGEMKDAARFSVAEVVGKGNKAATFDGKIDGLRIVGTWKDPKAAAALPFNAGPLAAFDANEKTFDQTYLGSIGEKLRIRMKLRRDGAKLSGSYRYPRSKEDIRLEGTVSDVDGKFELVEKTGKEPNGRFEGVFLQRGLAFARWTGGAAPEATGARHEGAKSSPVTLRFGDVYPEPVALPSGAGKIVPQEDFKEQGKFCAMSIFFPEVAGSENRAAEKTLNTALRAAAGDAKKMKCEGATEENHYETDTTYHVDATRPGGFAFTYQVYEYGGGAHGMRSIECFAADVAKGTLTKTTAKALSADAKKKVQELANAVLHKAQDAAGTQKLTEVGFHADDVAIGDDTSLCVNGTDLVVQFQVNEVAPYAMGAPSAKIPAKDAAPLVTGTPLEPFVK